MFVGRPPGNYDRLLDFTRANKLTKLMTLTCLRANHYRYVSMVAEFATWFANRFVSSGLRVTSRTTRSMPCTAKRTGETSRE